MKKKLKLYKVLKKKTHKLHNNKVIINKYNNYKLKRIRDLNIIHLMKEFIIHFI